MRRISSAAVIAVTRTAHFFNLTAIAKTRSRWLPEREVRRPASRQRNEVGTSSPRRDERANATWRGHLDGGGPSESRWVVTRWQRKSRRSRWEFALKDTRRGCAWCSKKYSTWLRIESRCRTPCRRSRVWRSLPTNSVLLFLTPERCRHRTTRLVQRQKVGVERTKPALPRRRRPVGRHPIARSNSLPERWI